MRNAASTVARPRSPGAQNAPIPTSLANLKASTAPCPPALQAAETRHAMGGARQRTCSTNAPAETLRQSAPIPSTTDRNATVTSETRPSPDPRNRAPRSAIQAVDAVGDRIPTAPAASAGKTVIAMMAITTSTPTKDRVFGRSLPVLAVPKAGHLARSLRQRPPICVHNRSNHAYIPSRSPTTRA